MNTDSYDYLIVGQGLAGSLLYWHLQKLGAGCMVVDSGIDGASMAAAGIINPMTGRNYVKSWMVDVVLPVARACYESLEGHYHQKLYYELPVYRALHSVKEENDWMARTADPAYDGYAGPIVDGTEVNTFLKHPVKYGKTKGAARVDLPLLIRCVREELISNGRFVKSAVDVNDITRDGGEWRWKGHRFKKVVFCQGYQAVYNPAFQYLPFAPAKGNILWIRASGVSMPFNLRDEFFITPVGNDCFWVGSGYRWGEWDTAVNQEDIEKMRAFAEDRLNFSWHVEETRAGIRPAMKTRRPVLGEHPNHEGWYIFNGLGTKGTSLGPYFAEMMAGFLEKGNELMPEVSIERYPFTS